MLLFETHVASRRLNSARKVRRTKHPAPHAEHTSPNAIDSHHVGVFRYPGVTLRQKPALHLERGRMKTFWTNLPLTIRAAVIFCYGYAVVRILNLFAEAGTAPLTRARSLTVPSPPWSSSVLVLYLGNALGAALRARREATSPARSASSSPTPSSWRCVPALPTASSLTPWRRGSPGSSARPRPGAGRGESGCSWRD